MSLFIDKLKADIENGFSMTQLEVLIGLPKNSLSKVIKGKGVLSKKSVAKIRRWHESKKPDPFTLGKISPTTRSIKKVDTKIIDKLSQLTVGNSEKKEQNNIMPKGLTLTEQLQWKIENP